MAELIIIVIGTFVGAVAGYSGGTVESLIMRVVDALYAFPDLLLVIIVMSYVKAQLGGPVAGWLAPVAATNEPWAGCWACSSRSGSPAGSPPVAWCAARS